MIGYAVFGDGVVPPDTGDLRVDEMQERSEANEARIDGHYARLLELRCQLLKQRRRYEAR